MVATGDVRGSQQVFRYGDETSMLQNMLKRAESGEPLFIGDVRNAFRNHPGATRIDCVLSLVEPGQARHFDIYVPPISTAAIDERHFVHSFLRAEVNNWLAMLGGRQLQFFVDSGQREIYRMVQQLPEDFHMDKPSADRPHYGQVVEVINRMLGALARDPYSGEAPQMEFVVRDSAEFDPSRLPGRAVTTPNDAFVEAGTDLGGKIIIGLDIGGSDIKGVVAVDGALAAAKEFDWDPASYGEPDQIIDPIMDNVRLLRAWGAASRLSDGSAEKQAVSAILSGVMAADVPHAQMRQAVERAEAKLGNQLACPNTIGLCFPDVVINNKVVGGATPKTSGLRASGDYETKFGMITHLDDRLRELCCPEGVVMMTNDGPMAAFTAAVEYAGNGHRNVTMGGMFSHAYGTDMATGYVAANGMVPNLPLEGYKMIIDLGSWDARFHPCDVRSNRDFTRSIPGAIQKYLGQSGAYRLAMKLFAQHEPRLYQQLFDKGFVHKADMGIYVTAKPDMRKPFLKHLQSLAADGVPAAQQIFTEMGGYIGHVYGETERILETGLAARYVFGRLVMDEAVFGLMQQGAMGVAPELNLVPADETMAHTPLMCQLGVGQFSHATVAQFGQAVGAVHFGNLGMKMQMGLIG